MVIFLIRIQEWDVIQIQVNLYKDCMLKKSEFECYLRII